MLWTLTRHSQVFNNGTCKVRLLLWTYLWTGSTKQATTTNNQLLQSHLLGRSPIYSETKFLCSYAFGFVSCCIVSLSSSTKIVSQSSLTLRPEGNSFEPRTTIGTCFGLQPVCSLLLPGWYGGPRSDLHRTSDNVWGFFTHFCTSTLAH